MDKYGPTKIFDIDIFIANIKQQFIKERKLSMGLNNKKNVHPMEYQGSAPEEVTLMVEAKEKFVEFYNYLDKAVPESAEKTLALRDLQRCRMMFNAAVTLNGLG